jgi:hypothetical protein
MNELAPTLNKKQRRRAWMNAAVAALTKRHVPEPMARAIINPSA